MEHDPKICEICKDIQEMNTTSNVTFLTLAIGSLSGVIASLQVHDYSVAIGMFIFGIVMVFVYEKTPPTTSA